MPGRVAVDLALSDIRSRLDNLTDIESYLAPDTEGVVKRAGLVWNVDTLSWIKAQQALLSTDTITVSLPATAATAARQDTGNTSLASIDGKLPAPSSGRVPVDGSGVTQPVSAASLPLPTGAATEATLTRTTPANTSVLSTRVALTDAAVALPASALADRKRVLAKNTGDNTAFIGGSGVTANGSSTDGIDLDPGQTLDAMIGASAVLYGRCATGLTTVLKILEFA